MATSDLDLPAIHDFLIGLARRAGAMITSATPTAAGHGTKKNSADLVTETDQAVEAMIAQTLRETYPDIAFLGEETTAAAEENGGGGGGGSKLAGRLPADGAPVFIVDPIDGTTNFFHGHPYVCVSLGLAVGGKPVVGVVFNPFTRRLYSAITGRGAFVTVDVGAASGETRTRLPLREPEPLRDLSHCLVAVEWGSDRDGGDYKVKVETFRTLCASKELGGAMVHGIRSLGSAELNLCGVAEGHLDVYWETGCWAWDVCAGWVIVEEAGGKMVGAHPGDWNPAVDQRRYMAVRAGEGQKAIIEEFWSCVKGKVEVGYDSVS